MDKGDLADAEMQALRSQAIGRQLNDPYILAVTQLQQAQVRMYGRKYDDAIPGSSNASGILRHIHPGMPPSLTTTSDLPMASKAT